MRNAKRRSRSDGARDANRATDVAVRPNCDSGRPRDRRFRRANRRRSPRGIERVLQDPAGAHRRVTAARTRVEVECAFRTRMATVEAIYDSIAASRRGAAAHTRRAPQHCDAMTSPLHPTTLHQDRVPCPCCAGRARPTSGRSPAIASSVSIVPAGLRQSASDGAVADAPVSRQGRRRPRPTSTHDGLDAQAAEYDRILSDVARLLPGPRPPPGRRLRGRVFHAAGGQRRIRT
jgi:hypothetical protein